MDAFVATHDRSHGDYQNQWNTLVGQGYRPISLSVYGTPTDARYAAVWVRRSGPAFAGIHGATHAQYQEFFNTWAAQGYSPTLLTATGAAGQAIFAGIMEKSDHGVSLTRHGLRSGAPTDQGTIEYWLAEARRRSLIPRCIAPYGTPNDRRFALVLDPNPDRELWSAAGWWGENATDYQHRFDAQAQQWARPALVSVGPDASFTSVFRADGIGPWVARHNMTSAGYQSEVDTWVARGYYPITVQAGGPAGNIRFAALFATRDTPAKRSYTVTGQSVPAFAAVDTKVENFMKTTGTRALGIAITRGGRLVHARGYTWAEDGYPTTQPTSMFRLASCSKPITSIAVHQLIEEGKLTLDRTMQSILGIQPAPGTNLDPRFAAISVLHLLTHTSGWDRTEVYDLPDVAAAARAFGQAALPVSKQRLASFKAGNPLQFSPGAEQEYSNLGYLLLGLIVERLRGTGYESAVRDSVFRRLGLTRPHRTPTRRDDQRPGAVRQHHTDPGDDLRLAPSAITGPTSGDRPLAPLPYGGEDYALFDAFGGWCMAPVDYAKLLAAFALGDRNPLLKKSSVDVMWTVPRLYQTATDVELPNYVNGWDSWQEPGGVRGFQHGGGMPGVATRVLYRTDGWGFAVFASGGSVPDIYPELATLRPGAWPAHDLFPSAGIPAFGLPTVAAERDGDGEAPGDHRPALAATAGE